MSKQRVSNQPGRKLTNGDRRQRPDKRRWDRLRKPKILRIGIIQGGRIVEERLVRKRENITIGQSAKNMFVVPSDALPRNWLLFEASGSQYVAHFSDGMDARIAVGNEIISLSQLKQTGKIQKKGTSLAAAARRALAREDHRWRT